MIIYKYFHPNRTSVLEEGLIRFTQSPSLNDPFETTPNMRPLEQSFRAYALRKIEEAKYPSVIEYVRDRSRVGSLVRRHTDEFLTLNKNKYAILSLSKINNNLLMWAHYCDSHRGFVVGFDSTNAFFQTMRANAFSVLAEVKYSSQRPVMPAPAKWDGTQAQIEQVVGSENLAELMFYTKSEDWAYEQELRMIANPQIANRHEKTEAGEDVYLFEFPRESLKEVILGIRMPTAQRRNIRNLVNARFDGVRFFEAVLSEERFDLDIVPC